MNNYYLIEKMPWGNISVVFNNDKQIIYASLSGDLPNNVEQGEWLELSKKLQSYGRGEVVDFTEELKTAHLPKFTRDVMQWLYKNCKWGETTTYGEIAKALGKPKAARAVGQVMGRNIIPLFVP